MPLFTLPAQEIMEVALSLPILHSYRGRTTSQQVLCAHCSQLELSMLSPFQTDSASCRTGYLLTAMNSSLKIHIQMQSQVQAPSSKLKSVRIWDSQYQSFPFVQEPPHSHPCYVQKGMEKVRGQCRRSPECQCLYSLNWGKGQTVMATSVVIHLCTYFAPCSCMQGVNLSSAEINGKIPTGLQ